MAIHWDKGIAHAAGNANAETLRQIPVVTESCAVYHRPGAERRRPRQDLGDLTNVWRHPAVRGAERLRNARGATHPNQKPMVLMKRLVRLFSERGGTVWDHEEKHSVSRVLGIDRERFDLVA